MTDELKAGRELDRLMAERVMGWRSVWVRGYNLGHFIGGHYDSREACAADCVNHCYEPIHLWVSADGTTFGKGETNWHPSEDIYAAWQVIETMKGVSVSHRADGKWTCWHWNRVHHSGAGETAPLAICRAALACAEYLDALKAVEQSQPNTEATPS